MQTKQAFEKVLALAEADAELCNQMMAQFSDGVIDLNLVELTRSAHDEHMDAVNRLDAFRPDAD